MLGGGGRNSLKALKQSPGQLIVSTLHNFFHAVLNKYHVEAAINELTFSLNMGENGRAALMLFLILFDSC